ncbi:hypothetical protein B0H10DRAFT_2226474 [Mycena sp. CBHHK59/15]|nr:hypothetical protein B0H10DRAFT_2226474 [Mycena sp. CBHHK59/15]
MREAENRDNLRKRAMLDMQAATVLAGMYSNRAQSQLQGIEERKQKKRGKRKMGDGKAKYFSGDDFYQLCLDDEKAKEDEAAEKEQRRVQREAHTSELAEWKKNNAAIRARNEAKKAKYAADKAAWDVESVAAKLQKRRPGWTKPKVKDYGVEVLLLRPKKPADEEKDESEEESEGSRTGSEMED